MGTLLNRTLSLLGTVGGWWLDLRFRAVASEVKFFRVEGFGF